MDGANGSGGEQTSSVGERQMVTLPGPDWHGPWEVPADAFPHMVDGVCYGYVEGRGLCNTQTAAEVAASLKAAT